jgi:hypothetical protein
VTRDRTVLGFGRPLTQQDPVFQSSRARDSPMRTPLGTAERRQRASSRRSAPRPCTKSD